MSGFPRPSDHSAPTALAVALAYGLDVGESYQRIRSRPALRAHRRSVGLARALPCPIVRAVLGK